MESESLLDTSAPESGDTGAEQPTSEEETGKTQEESPVEGKAEAKDESLIEGKEWFLSEGVKGEGPPPEWFKADKYKTIVDQAKAQPELEKLLGKQAEKLKGFVGAPEKYEISVPDEIKDAVELSPDDPLLVQFQEIAKESGMNQDTFTKLFHAFAQYEYSQESVDLKAEKEALGERADARIKGLSEWASAHLSSEQYQVLMSAMGRRSTPSEVFKAVESVLYASKQATLPKHDETVQAGSMTKAEWDREWNAVNDKGQRIVEVDPAKRQELREKLRAIVGDGDHIEVMGAK